MPSEQAATARIMQKIRQTIFQSSSGDIDGTYNSSSPLPIIVFIIL